MSQPAQRQVHPAVFAFATGVGLLTDKYILGAANFVQWSFGKEGTVESNIDKAAALAFAVVGMIIFGPLSDRLGRRTCMLLTSFLTIIGAVGCAAANCEWTLIAFRMVTGLGMGGEYPLASTHTAKNSDKNNASRNVGLLYLFGSGIGQALCPTVVWITLACGADKDFSWRFMFAFAAMLSTAGLVLRYLTTSDDENISAEESNELRSADNLFSRLTVFWRPLLGAAAGWFMYDLVEYGLKSNDTDLFGHGTDPLSEARGVAYNRYFQILPLAIAAAALAFISTKQSQLIGFLGCGIICSILAADYDGLHSDTGNSVGFDALYISQMAFQAFCGTSTMAISSQVFPRSFVGTGAGISAATGKIGATIGTYLFAAWTGEWVKIFTTCTATCVLGLLVTLMAVPHYRGEHLKRMESLAAAGLEKQAVQSLYKPLSLTKAVDEPPTQPLV